MEERRREQAPDGKTDGGSGGPDVKRDQDEYPLEQHGYADPDDIGRTQDDLERVEEEGDETPMPPAEGAGDR